MSPAGLREKSARTSCRWDGLRSVITSGSVITAAKVTEHEVKIELDADVLFDSDKYNLRPEAEYGQDTRRVTRKRQENSMVALDTTIQTKRFRKI